MTEQDPSTPTAEAVDDDRPSGPRSQKGVQTRARFVGAAKSVFEDVGFVDARISDIAERAGVSHGSFYYYFDSKEEIFGEVAESMEEQFGVHSAIETGLWDARSGQTMQERFFESSRRFLEDYRREARIMGVIEQVCRYNEQVRTARFARQKVFNDRAEAAIRGLQRRGIADGRLDPAIVAPALSAMVNRFAEMWLTHDQVDCSFDQGVEQIATLCMNALGLKATDEI